MLNNIVQIKKIEFKNFKLESQNWLILYKMYNGG